MYFNFTGVKDIHLVQITSQKPSPDFLFSWPFKTELTCNLTKAWSRADEHLISLDHKIICGSQFLEDGAAHTCSTGTIQSYLDFHIPALQLFFVTCHLIHSCV